MSGPGPTTMKTIQKRIYAALPRTVSSPTSCSSPVSIPRVRANSASSARSFYTAATSSLPNPSTLSIFDAPSSASGSRPATSPRLSLQPRCEAEGQSNSPSAPLGSPPFTIFHSSLQPNASLTTSHSAFPPLFSFSTNPFSVDSAHDLPHSSRKRHSPRYHLDIGAYGIPKSTNSTRVTGWDGCGQFLRPKHRENPNLAVQVGEDAYFVRDDAMGVADGVGGWSKVKSYDVAFCGPFVSSPSAVFARHLMHFCSAEVENARSSSASRLKPNDARCLPRAHFAMQPGHHFTPSIDAHRRGSRPDEVLEDSEDPLESLEDGIDVLVILQRAYEKAMKAHVTPSKPNMTADPVEGVPAPSAYASSPVLSLTPSTPVPLLAGSSTALLAVLDQSLSHSELSTVEPSLGSKATYDAVIKIAHIGDCMGMLIRGDEITWRSEEMWWSFNTPVQLGPSSSAMPQDAHVFTLPVQADDILILASDGLSDNLWDEDVLDEVIRFRRTLLDDCETGESVMQRQTLASMLSQALCSRARRISERKHGPDADDEVPFARRARECGKRFVGGKTDDISVIVAVISPIADVSRHQS